VFAAHGKNYIHGFTKAKDVTAAGDDEKILVQSNAEQLLLDFKHAVKQRSETAKKTAQRSYSLFVAQ
jgi:hypothetical protein